MVAFHEFGGPSFDTCIVHEVKLKDGLRTSLHKNDRYFYENIVYFVSVMM